MRSRQSRAPVDPDIAPPASPVPGGSFVPFTEETVTDDMIHAMRDHARGLTGARVDPDLVLECSKALRHPGTCRSERDTERRLAARRTCVQVINERAARWLERGKRDDRLYAQLAGLIPRRPRAAGSRTSAARVAPTHPLCWECNDPIGARQHRAVRVRGGMVSVHLACIDDIDDDALDEDTGVYPAPWFGGDHREEHDRGGELADGIDWVGDDEALDRNGAEDEVDP